MDTGEFLLRYLGSFIFAIGLIYALYYLIKKNPTLLSISKNRVPFKQGLQVESYLPLEARKNLYIVRAGQERFLLATSLEGTQFLSKLEKLESVEETVSEETNTVESAEGQGVRLSVRDSLKTISAEALQVAAPQVTDAPPAQDSPVLYREPSGWYQAMIMTWAQRMCQWIQGVFKQENTPTAFKREV